ncbi:MAG: [FeFe] hydrogenase H-cluster radical SAM maturase HydG [Armatimonadetes bacterium]|nr:[FeFe] hydrogenase H-cluster radical SAM maturase HydG [Candidatus Hippobium faecium]
MDEERIFNALENADLCEEHITDILEKSKDGKGISIEEAACLIKLTDKKLLNKLYETAGYLKNKIYGKRLVFFAPMYVSNICANNCLYCGFRCENKDLERICLDEEGVAGETMALLKEGHKRVLVVAGEHPKYSGVEYIEKTVNAVYSAKYNGVGIRRVNVNCAPLSVEDYKRVKACGIGTYQIFQETYHYDSYMKYHVSGTKRNMANRLTGLDRAIEAGIDDVGIGALYGLYDYKFETLAVLEHCDHLNELFNIGPHTISVPRLEPALNAPVANNIPYPVTQDDMRKIVSVFRVAVPYTGIILSTRETPEFRNELINLGVSQISAGSRVGPGEYSKAEGLVERKDQFHVGDERTLSQMIDMLMEGEFIPSFCTACYRRGRTGEEFMKFAKEGEIHQMCLPNALLSFREYLYDFGSEEAKAKGNKIIDKQVEELPENMKNTVKKLIANIDNGEKDQYI